MGGFRWKLAGVISTALVMGLVTGCKSNSSSAINDEGTPTADTGFISAATTGGDAAGTANMKVEEGKGEAGDVGAEHMQGGRASTTPQQQGGASGG